MDIRNDNSSALIAGYGNWLERYRNCAVSTVRLRASYLSKFFKFTEKSWNQERVASLTQNELETHFIGYCETHGQSARRSMQATLRLFLRYCFSNGITNKDLSLSIPTLRTYKLATTPKGISDEDAQRILGTINRTTPVGRRDYAIVRMLYHYGVRAGQISSLQLRDISWRKETITFRALKHGKTVVVPLLIEVGNALADYLQQDRPQELSDSVFLTMCKPYRPLGVHTTVSEIVARRMREQKIALPRGGSCAFRHSFAQRMLRQGNSLKSIADCLGHRSIQTTAIYAKVDFLALNNVGLDLPTKEAL